MSTSIFRTMIRFVILLSAIAFTNKPLLSQNQSAWSNIFKAINEEVLQHSTAYTQLHNVTRQIGHRLTGSLQGAKAEAYAYQLLTSYGLNVRYEPFEAEGWSRGSLTLEINQKNYKAVSLAHTPESVNISDSLVDMGNGLEEDYLLNPGAAKDKIVFAALGLLPGSAKGTQNLHRSEKTALAIRNGAKGIIFYNSAPGNILLTGTASVTGQIISIPAVCIGNEDGLRLKEQLKNNTAVAGIVMSNFVGKMKARNIIATIPGKKYPSEKIVIGAHLDSWDLATGAIDNGIGAFTVIDIARTFMASGLRPARSVEFVLFMGEEQGLLGSKAYIKKALNDKTAANIKYMFNLDMSNNPKGYSSTTDDDKLLFTSIGAIAKAIDSSFGNSFRSGYGLHSDHQPFMLQGIPIAGVAGVLSKQALQCYHADCDVFELVNEQELKNTVRFSAMLLYGLADAPRLMAKRLSDDELKAALIKSNLKQPLKISGDWRWTDE